MTAGEWLGWINARIILSLVFYGIVTPMGVLMRRLSHDPMQRRFNPQATTYRVPKAARPAEHLIRQY